MIGCSIRVVTVILGYLNLLIATSWGPIFGIWGPPKSWGPRRLPTLPTPKAGPATRGTVFKTLVFLPDPVPQGDGHYKPFDTVYNTVTSKEHRPSLQNRPARQKTLTFVASVQHS